MPAPKIRLVEVRVQPVFMLDDGTDLTPVDHPPVAIPAAEWPTYSVERFPREIAEWQERLTAEYHAEHPAPMDGFAIGTVAFKPPSAAT